MDTYDTSSENEGDDRSSIMSAFLMRMSEFFCPSDRELALRGQIKTGWSTVAARKKSRSSQIRLPPQEVKHVKEVIAQADAFQMSEEIRIGIQMLKLQRLRESCRGNGTSSCILCGHDFAHHRSRSPISLHFCHECAKAVCSRCKSEYKCCNGETIVLCRLCNDERELWKKSGAWLSNQLPVISISKEELEKAQQQQQMHKVVPVRTEFVSPSRLDEDEETEDDLSSSISGSPATYGGFPYHAGSIPSSRSPSPELAFVTEANPAAAAWKSDQQSYQSELQPGHSGTPPRRLNEKNQGLPMRKSGSYDLVAIRRQRSSTTPHQGHSLGGQLARKSAMGGERRKDMEELRRKVVERKKVTEQRKSMEGEGSRTPSPTVSLEATPMKRSKSTESSFAQLYASPRLGSPHPHIKVHQATAPVSPENLTSHSPQPAKALQPDEPVPVEPVQQPPKPAHQEKPHVTSDGVDTHSVQVSSQGNSNVSPVAAQRRKPVPTPRKKQNISNTQPSLSQSSHEMEEFKRVVTGSQQKGAGQEKSASLEREKKGIGQEKSASLEREKKGNEFRINTLERKQRRSKTPEPPADEFRKVGVAKKTHGGASRPDTSSPSFAPVLPSEVTNEFEKVLMPRSSLELSSSMEEEDTANPKLQDIGKHTSITSEGSVEGSREHAGSLTSLGSEESGNLGDHHWKRKGARRVTRTRSPAAASQPDVDGDESSPRSRSRSGALAGSDAHKLKRGRNVRGTRSPISQRHSGQTAGGTSTVSTPPAADTAQHSTDPDSFEEAMSMRRVGSRRRAARTGSDLLVADDGEN